MRPFSQRGHVHLTNLRHCICLCLGDLGWLGQNAVAGVETSATTGDLQNELGYCVIVEAVVTVLQCFGDAFTQTTLLKEQKLKTLALNRPSPYSYVSWGLVVCDIGDGLIWIQAVSDD